MKRYLIILTALLAGCNTVTSQLLPSLDLCSHVNYERTGKEIKVQAECTAP